MTDNVNVPRFQIEDWRNDLSHHGVGDIAAAVEMDNLLAAAPKAVPVSDPDELDLYDVRVQAGISWALNQVGLSLGLSLGDWDGGDGSESVEGDVGAEIESILVSAKLRDPETGALATLQPEAPKVEQGPTAWAYRLSFPDENTAWEWEVGKEKMTEEKFGSHGGVLETIPLFAHPAPTGQLPASIRDIADERRRQVDVEGYSHSRDDGYERGELGLAAALYALPYDAEQGGEKLISQDDFIGLHVALDIGCGWDLKPEIEPRRRMVKAGALIAAEIERLDRIAKHKGPQS